MIGFAAAPVALFAPDLLALQDDGIDPKKLKPGQFAWNPDRAPEGPVVVVVSIPDQMVTVYRNGVRIAVSTCSTGRPGHATPTGTFVILQKDVNHHSSLYDDAPMPYMERLTWGGVALHAGNLPGYPASHGCVRLPKAFAQLLYGVTQLGTTVIIGDHDTVPADVLHSGVLISQHTEDMAKEAVQQAKANAQSAQPGPAGAPAVSAVISTADKKIIVYQNGVPAFEDKVTLKQPDEPFGTHVFNLTGPSDNPGKLKWMAVDMGTDAVTDLGQDNGTPAQALGPALRRHDGSDRCSGSYGPALGRAAAPGDHAGDYRQAGQRRVIFGTRIYHHDWRRFVTAPGNLSLHPDGFGNGEICAVSIGVTAHAARVT